MRHNIIYVWFLEFVGSVVNGVGCYRCGKRFYRKK